MEHIINQTEESASRVLNFYESVGTSLSYQPRFQYIEGIYQQMPDALAMVRGEFETLKSNIRFLSQGLAKTIWKEVYGIDVSDEAIEEVADIQISKFGKILIPAEFESGPDILIFQPYQDYCKKQEDRDEIIAHEIWHLIENERGLFKEHPFIKEGTATYAMRRFRGKKCNKPFEKFEDFFKMMYLGAANIVQDYVGNTENPFQTMLNQQVRDQIERNLLERVKPVLSKNLRNSLKDENTKKAVVLALREIPEFRRLEGNLTQEGILNAYREMGANKIAEELKGKNLEGLIYWFRVIGF